MDGSLYVTIENEINNIRRRMKQGETFSFISDSKSPEKTPDINEFIEKHPELKQPVQTSVTMYQFILDHIGGIAEINNWNKNNGELCEEKIKKAAPLTNNSWDRIKYSNRGHEPKILYRLIFLMRLNEEQAHEFLSLDSKVLNPMNDEDCLVLALIRCGIYDRESVYNAFDFFSKKGSRFENIYASPQ